MRGCPSPEGFSAARVCSSAFGVHANPHLEPGNDQHASLLDLHARFFAGGLLAFSKDFGAFHFGYVFEAGSNKLADLFESVGDFDVVIVANSLEHGLFERARCATKRDEDHALTHNRYYRSSEKRDYWSIVAYLLRLASQTRSVRFGTLLKNNPCCRDCEDQC